MMSISRCMSTISASLSASCGSLVISSVVALDSRLHDFGRTCKRLVESFSDGWLANGDEPGLVGREFLSRLTGLVELSSANALRRWLKHQLALVNICCRDLGDGHGQLVVT